MDIRKLAFNVLFADKLIVCALIDCALLLIPFVFYKREFGNILRSVGRLSASYQHINNVAFN